MLATLLVLASVTDKLVDWVTNVVGDLGLPGIFLLMMLESTCIPIPSRADDAVRRLQRLEGDVLVLVAVVLVGDGREPRRLVDRLRASGYYGRHRAGRAPRQEAAHQASHLEWADRWFERYGDGAVFFARMLPIIRTFISLPAGVARMPFWRFTVLTVARAASRGCSC